MRTIKFKEFTVKLPGGSNVLETTAGLCFKALEHPPKKGFTLKEMRKRMNVIKKFEEANNSIDLEDAEIIMVADCFNAVPWTIMSENILNLGEELEKMKGECN